MANRWGKVEAVTDFIFLGSKINADSDYSHEIKILAPWKKSYDNPRQYIQKQRHHFAIKICIVKAVVFPVVMYGCESWTKRRLSDEELMFFNYGAGEDS